MPGWGSRRVREHMTKSTIWVAGKSGSMRGDTPHNVVCRGALRADMERRQRESHLIYYGTMVVLYIKIMQRVIAKPIGSV